LGGRHTLNVINASLPAGAGFVVVIAGNMIAQQ